MSESEAEIRESIIKDISHDLKILLENTAHLGLDAVRPRPNCDTTYVEAVHLSMINNIRYGNKRK